MSGWREVGIGSSHGFVERWFLRCSGSVFRTRVKKINRWQAKINVARALHWPVSEPIVAHWVIVSCPHVDVSLYMIPVARVAIRSKINKGLNARLDGVFQIALLISAFLSAPNNWIPVQVHTNKINQSTELISRLYFSVQSLLSLNPEVQCHETTIRRWTDSWLICF